MSSHSDKQAQLDALVQQAAQRWQQDAALDVSTLSSPMRFALAVRDFDFDPSGWLVGPLFATSMPAPCASHPAPGRIVFRCGEHLVLGIVSDTDAPGAVLEIGGQEIDSMPLHANHARALVGGSYALPSPEYHEVRVLNVPVRATVHAIVARVAESARSVLCQPMLVHHSHNASASALLQVQTGMVTRCALGADDLGVQWLTMKPLI